MQPGRSGTAPVTPTTVERCFKSGLHLALSSVQNSSWPSPLLPELFGGAAVSCWKALLSGYAGAPVGSSDFAQWAPGAGMRGGGGRARGTWPAAPTPSFPHPQLLQLTAPTTPVPQGTVPGGCEAAQVSSGHPLEFSVKTWLAGMGPLLRRLESACLLPGQSADRVPPPRAPGPLLTTNSQCFVLILSLVCSGAALPQDCRATSLSNPCTPPPPSASPEPWQLYVAF